MSEATSSGGRPTPGSKLPSVSVLLPVWQGDTGPWLTEAFESIESQTLQPDQIVVVQDGPVSEDVAVVVDRYGARENFYILRLPENEGLSRALNHALEVCNSELVARLDADDRWLPDHLNLVVNAFAKEGDATIVGSQYETRTSDMARQLGVRKVPLSSRDISRFSRYRTPINHPTIVFDRKTIIDLGAYPTDLGRFEDWGLARRVLTNGHRIANIPDLTLQFRSGDQLLGRRSGLAYLFEECRAVLRMARSGLLSRRHAAMSILLRAPIRLLPTSAIASLYRHALHRGPKNE